MSAQTGETIEVSRNLERGEDHAAFQVAAKSPARKRDTAPGRLHHLFTVSLHTDAAQAFLVIKIFQGTSTRSLSCAWKSDWQRLRKAGGKKQFQRPKHMKYVLFNNIVPWKAPDASLRNTSNAAHLSGIGFRHVQLQSSINPYGRSDRTYAHEFKLINHILVALLTTQRMCKAVQKLKHCEVYCLATSSSEKSLMHP